MKVSNVKAATSSYAKGLELPFGADDRFAGIRFRPGEISVLIGGDGAGKSAMLRLLAEPGSGQAPEDVGYQPSSSGTWPQLTVRENLGFVAGLYGLDGNLARERGDKLIRAAALDGAEDRLAANLSGGMRQKLGVIMAMLPSPFLLILDEPTTGVDVDSRGRLWELMALAAEEGAIVVASTTYLDEAERAAQVIFLDDGEVMAAGTPAEVIAAAPGRVLRELADDAGTRDGGARTYSGDARSCFGDARSWRRGHERYRWVPDSGENSGGAVDCPGEGPGEDRGRPAGHGHWVPADMDLELATIAHLLDREKGVPSGDGTAITGLVALRESGHHWSRRPG